MNFLTYFIIFLIFFAIFSWIIKKTDVHNTLFSKPQKYKYTRIILILMVLFLTLLLEYGKELLNDKYGQHNYICTIVGAFLTSIYFNFAPVIFRRVKQ
ncbi:hypothetical protein BN000_03391 [Neobacillus massiliamazoniensis]|uniref:Uncharacterized protein n=1 Tax=Neobacillus massiliamazoniensis TaxID=1499688 RepID=A0A0U1NZK6_9BACI|nr:hypothetical protein BN000_03391 [Neobacillus massiliamazoniensis]